MGECTMSQPLKFQTETLPEEEKESPLNITSSDGHICTTESDPKQIDNEKVLLLKTDSNPLVDDTLKAITSGSKPMFALSESLDCQTEVIQATHADLTAHPD